MSARNIDGLPYRPCVGIVLFNQARKIFVGERIDSPNAWQMPQGGIDPGEDIETAFYRELREETGTDKAEIILIMDRTLKYDLPPDLQTRLWNGAYRGQEQTWVAARFTGTDSDINLNAHTPAEFQKWQWVLPHEAMNLIVPFKKETYREVIGAFENITL